LISKVEPKDATLLTRVRQQEHRRIKVLSKPDGEITTDYDLDHVGLGKLEVCYSIVRWVSLTEPVSMNAGHGVWRELGISFGRD